MSCVWASSRESLRKVQRTCTQARAWQEIGGKACCCRAPVPSDPLLCQDRGFCDTPLAHTPWAAAAQHRKRNMIAQPALAVWGYWSRSASTGQQEQRDCPTRASCAMRNQTPDTVFHAAQHRVLGGELLPPSFDIYGASSSLLMARSKPWSERKSSIHNLKNGFFLHLDTGTSPPAPSYKNAKPSLSVFTCVNSELSTASGEHAYCII